MFQENTKVDDDVYEGIDNCVNNDVNVSNDNGNSYESYSDNNDDIIVNDSILVIICLK